MMADRGAGYHTKPHVHDCEQWNYIISGEIWFFVEEHGYRCRKGDVMRIPRNRPHWAYNRRFGAFVVASLLLAAAPAGAADRITITNYGTNIGTLP
jgi:quercetin dioxygenase-like cupin family protein